MSMVLAPVSEKVAQSWQPRLQPIVLDSTWKFLQPGPTIYLVGSAVTVCMYVTRRQLKSPAKAGWRGRGSAVCEQDCEDEAKQGWNEEILRCPAQVHVKRSHAEMPESSRQVWQVWERRSHVRAGWKEFSETPEMRCQLWSAWGTDTGFEL